MKFLITGVRGFIGSAFVRWWVQRQTGKGMRHQLVAFARNTNHWARGRLEDDTNVSWVENRGMVKIVYGDLLGDISGLCEGVDCVINFAAKSFVDHSIKDPLAFIESNTLGTARLLEEARRQGVKRFIQVSTDEVYGSIDEGEFTEDSPCFPRNPYAASKAAADCIVTSYNRTYGMWTAITRTENNYGPYQHAQKAIPVFIRKALANEPIQIYGDGQHVRQWLYVDDHAKGIYELARGEEIPGGEIWNIGGGKELTNIELAQIILRKLGKEEDAFELIDDSVIRPGHDRRYAMDCAKMTKLGWKPQTVFEDGLAHTVKWYRENQAWLRG